MANNKNEVLMPLSPNINDNTHHYRVGYGMFPIGVNYPLRQQVTWGTLARGL
ncbi:hypothetical protein [Sodalis sp. RH22]|uniref:hypothetical protein n=1 Tax=unclassified Sodalis (in: enterobacteria) TaxID=2636512 RepID=UPI0039B570DE